MIVDRARLAGQLLAGPLAPSPVALRQAHAPGRRGLTLEEDAGPAWPPDGAPVLLETSTPGVFAAGDVRAGSVKRVASAVGQGALAVTPVHAHLAAQAAARV